MPTIVIPSYEGFCADCGMRAVFRSVAVGDVRPRQTRYNVLRCMHCGGVRFIIEAREGGNGGDPWFREIACYPAQPFVARPAWLDRLGDEPKKIMRSVYAALDQRLFFLASVGVRTALDRLITERIGDVGTFERKMEVLRKGGYVDDSHDKILKALFDAGSASAHRGFEPNEELSRGIIELAEHIIYKLAFEKDEIAALVSKAKKLRHETPQRKKPA